MCRSVPAICWGAGVAALAANSSRVWRPLRYLSAGCPPTQASPPPALAERGLGGGEACDGNAERRARDVIERNLVAERDRSGVAAVLAADPDLELRLRLPTALDADPHQFAHALAVDGDERIARENPARHVGAEKARGVAAANAEGGRRQVGGAEGREFRGLGDVGGAQ